MDRLKEDFEKIFRKYDRHFESADEVSLADLRIVSQGDFCENIPDNFFGLGMTQKVESGDSAVIKKLKKNTKDFLTDTVRLIELEEIQSSHPENCRSSIFSSKSGTTSSLADAIAHFEKTATETFASIKTHLPSDCLPCFPSPSPNTRQPLNPILPSNKSWDLGPPPMSAGHRHPSSSRLEQSAPPVRSLFPCRKLPSSPPILSERQSSRLEQTTPMPPPRVSSHFEHPSLSMPPTSLTSSRLEQTTPMPSPRVSSHLDQSSLSTSPPRLSSRLDQATPFMPQSSLTSSRLEQLSLPSPKLILSRVDQQPPPLPPSIRSSSSACPDLPPPPRIASGAFIISTKSPLEASETRVNSSVRNTELWQSPLLSEPRRQQWPRNEDSVLSQRPVQNRVRLSNKRGPPGGLTITNKGRIYKSKLARSGISITFPVPSKTVSSIADCSFTGTDHLESITDIVERSGNQRLLTPMTGRILYKGVLRSARHAKDA